MFTEEAKAEREFFSAKQNMEKAIKEFKAAESKLRKFKGSGFLAQDSTKELMEFNARATSAGAYEKTDC